MILKMPSRGNLSIKLSSVYPAKAAKARVKRMVRLYTKPSPETDLPGGPCGLALEESAIYYWCLSQRHFRFQSPELSSNIVCIEKCSTSTVS